MRALCVANLALAPKRDLCPRASEAIRLLLTPLADTTQAVVLHALRLRSEMLRKLVSLSDHSIGDVVV
jgi:hypothetical protein